MTSRRDGRKRAETGGARWPWLLALGVLAAYAAWRVIAGAWLCDDTFISLRCAGNLIHGHGLVYNPGERVEAYTDLLWVLAIAGAGAVGVPLETAALALGMLSYATLAGILVAWWWSRRGSLGPFPIAAGLVLALSDFHTWATGGLETSMFAALALGGLVLACRRAPTRASDLAASALLGLAVLARPDGVLFVAFALTRPWWERGVPVPDRVRRTLLLAAPAALIVGAQVVFKLVYYHELFPTAFYAKSATRAYGTQGLLYVGLWLAKNWAVLPVAIAALLWGRGRGAGRPRTDALFLGAAGALFLGYVIYTGGDFMFARRLIPCLPLLFIALEHAMHRQRPAWATPVLLGVLLAGALLPYNPFGPRYAQVSGIADQPRFMPAWVLDMRRQQGQVVGEQMRGTPARVMYEGGMCSFAYYSRLPYLIEMTGLTQYSLARLPITARGRIGHEKSATPRWLDENGVNLVFAQQPPPFAPGPRGPTVDELYFGWLARARIVRYSDAVMDPLRGRPGVVFVPIERVLAEARDSLRVASPEAAKEIVRGLDDYYFRSGGPKARAAAAEFQSLMAARIAAGTRRSRAAR
jgi:arabinofuranosyltransferase